MKTAGKKHMTIFHLGKNSGDMLSKITNEK